MRFRMGVVFLVLVVLTAARPSHATRIRPLGFAQMVQEAAVVVEGTVVAAEAEEVGDDIRRLIDKRSSAPRAQPEESEAEEAEASPAQDSGGPPAAPQGVPAEGGRMIFTEVTLEVEDALYGDVGDTVTLRVAGGTVGERTAIVFGMPAFEVGKRYLLFLVPEYRATGVPIVGVNQGFFEVVSDDDGEGYLLNADGDVVLGIEDDRVVVRRNPSDTRKAPALGPAPTPEEGSGVRSRTSPSVARYWQSQEAPMRTESFFETVRSMKGDER